MPSKSDTHRRSGFYEAQSNTAVSNNCAQDRERYGIHRQTSALEQTQCSCWKTSLFWKETANVFTVCLMCVLAPEQPGWQLHRGAEFRNSGQSQHQPQHHPHHHAGLRRGFRRRRALGHHRHLQSFVSLRR